MSSSNFQAVRLYKGSREVGGPKSWSCPRIIRLVVLVSCLVVLAGCEPIWTLLGEDRRPSRYLIPEGYVGWVRVDYEVEGAPELPIENGFRVYRIPPSGLLETSSTMESGWASDEYYYVNASGDRKQLAVTTRDGEGQIWGKDLLLGMAREERDRASTATSESVAHEQFFVGPEELAQQEARRSAEGEPLYGPIS